MTVKRKIIIMVLTVILGLFSAGCSTEKLDAFIRTDVTTAIDSRVSANLSIVEKLKSAGLLTEDEATKLKESLQNAASAYSGDKLASNEKLRTDLFNAVVDWRAPVFTPGRDGKMDGLGEKEWYDAHITSYVATKASKEAKESIPLFKGTGSQVIPITLIDAKTGADLNSKFGFEVQVLKPMAEMENAKSMDDVMARIASAIKSDGSVDESILAQVFEGAKDSEGKAVKLLDTTDPKYQVVKASSGSAKVGTDNKTKSSYSVTSSTQLSLSSGYNAKPGVDMVIKSNASSTDLMAVRFIEFDQDAVDRVIANIGVNPDQYLFYNNKVYVMEYPVYVVDEILLEAGSRFKSSFVKSEMGINIRTGKLVRKGTDGGIYMESSEPYLNVNGAKSNQQDSKSSFTIMGEAEDGLEFVRESGSVSIRSARIVLRDYLEATYAPGIVNNEKLVVLGRKLRVKNFTGSTSTIFADFYDKEGNKLANTNSIYIKDIADFDSLAGSSPIVKRLPRDGEVEGIQKSPEIVSGSNLAKVDELDKHLVSKIKPVSPFPGRKLGSVDNGVSSKPLFYAMVVTTSAFDSGLFSGWINNGDLTKNSMGWWQSWLANPSRSYLYRINGSALENYLVDNYASDLQQSGMVMLELEVIAAIQGQMNANNRNNTIARFRTTFIVLGWGLMVYGMILMMAWVLDTNVDLGFNLLEKLSFGNMIATKDPYIQDGRYVGIGMVIKKSIVLLVVGVMLISLNVMDVILMIVKMFGGVSDIITGLMSGM